MLIRTGKERARPQIGQAAPGIGNAGRPAAPVGGMARAEASARVARGPGIRGKLLKLLDS